jgi:hypothetical protein
MDGLVNNLLYFYGGGFLFEPGLIGLAGKCRD